MINPPMAQLSTIGGSDYALKVLEEELTINSI